MQPVPDRSPTQTWAELSDRMRKQQDRTMKKGCRCSMGHQPNAKIRCGEDGPGWQLSAVFGEQGQEKMQK